MVGLQYWWLMNSKIRNDVNKPESKQEGKKKGNEQLTIEEQLVLFAEIIIEIYQEQENEKKNQSWIHFGKKDGWTV